MTFLFPLFFLKDRDVNEGPSVDVFIDPETIRKKLFMDNVYPN